MVNTTTHPVTNISVGSSPTGMAISGDGSRLYVAKASPSNNLAVVNTSTRAVIASIPLGQTAIPFAVAISPDDAEVTVGYDSAGAFVVVDTRSLAVAQTISSWESPFALAYSSDGAYLYSALYGVDVIARWSVTPAPPYTAPQELASTGTNPVAWLWMGVGVLVAGIGALGLGRSRRRTR